MVGEGGEVQSIPTECINGMCRPAQGSTNLMAGMCVGGRIQEDFLEEVMPDVVVDGQVGKGILGQRPAGAWSRASLIGVWRAFGSTLLKDPGQKVPGYEGRGAGRSQPPGAIRD